MKYLIHKLSIFTPGIFIAWVTVFIVVRFPSNHALGIIEYYPLVYVSIAVCAIDWCLSRRIPTSGILLIVVFLLLLVSIDRLNIYISYEEWIDRGMPEWGQARLPKE